MRASVALALVAACGCGGRGRAGARAKPAGPVPPPALLAVSIRCAPSLCLDGDWFELRFDNRTAAPVWPACWSHDPLVLAPGAARAWAAPVPGVAPADGRWTFEVVARWRESPGPDAVDAREARRGWKLAVVPTGPPRAGCVPVSCRADRARSV